MNFSEKLKEIRKDKGLSQEQLAEKNRCVKAGYHEMGNRKGVAGCRKYGYHCRNI